MITDKRLVELAWEARERANAAYSGYRVGAALVASNGQVYTGSNVESSSYGLSCCAERVALFKALGDGEKDFVKVAVAAEGPLTPVPCGACRQLLAEYAPGTAVLLAAQRGTFEKTTLAELFPRPFTAEFLK